VAGEIHQDGEQKSEVVLMAAQKNWVNQFLDAGARAKLDVVGMNVEPLAVVDCFSHVYRRKSDAEATTLFVDIGCVATRAFIARGQQVLFARNIALGGDQFTRAVAQSLGIPFEEAKIRRVRACEEPAEGVAPQPVKPDGDWEKLAEASVEPVAKLVEELSLCRRYHEATFPATPIDRIVFIGGEARQRALCQAVAQGLELAAQLGDPMIRMARTTEVGPESGLDRRLPQPDWCVALGLSMGPVSAPVKVNAK
jgi:type IV pilus assembly protein PilM